MSDYIIVNGELRHFGIKGMKWGVRRYQNSDGTLTAAGKKRYDGDWDSKSHRPKSTTSKTSGSKGSSKAGNNDESEKKGLTDKQKKALKIGAVAVGTAVAAYGAYKLKDAIKDKNFQIMAEKGKKVSEDFFNENYQNRGISVFKDGSAHVTVTKKLNNSTSKFAFKNEADARKLLTEIDMENLKLNEKSADIFKEYLDKGSNASLKEATKNVSTYYTDKAKEKVAEKISNAAAKRERSKRQTEMYKRHLANAKRKK